MKRYCIFALLFLALALTACGQQPAAQAGATDAQSAAQEYSVPTFRLDNLPALPSYTGLPKEIYTRYSQEAYVNTLKPAADYGQLYPYFGKTLLDSFEAAEFRYGLSDAQGRIVVDPVYSSVSPVDTGPDQGADYWKLVYPVDKLDAEAQQALQATGVYDTRTRYQFAKADGTWVSPVYFGNDATLSGDRVIVTLQNNDPQYAYSPIASKYQLYDLEGNLISEGDGAISGFSGDLAVVHNMKDYDSPAVCTYIDKNGKTAIAGPFSSATDFLNGQACVALDNDTLFAVIDGQGNYIIQPEKIGDSVSLSDNSDYMAFTENGLQGMIDRMGNIVVPAVYNSVPYYDNSDGSLLLAYKPDNSYDAIDLAAGKTTSLGSDYSYVYNSGDNWLIASVWSTDSDNYVPPDYYILRGETRYPFLSSEYGDVSLSYLANDIFAVNSSGDSADQYKVSFFDANKGEIIKSFSGLNCYSSEETPQGTVYYLMDNYSQKITALSADFEPLFTQDEMAGADAFRSISYLKDGLFSVRTDRYGGLMRMDGSWLIRVIASSVD